MASLSGNFDFEGRLGNVTAYRMKGVDKLVLRTRGGPNKNAIKNSPAFAKTRQQNTKWSGCTKAASKMRIALRCLNIKRICLKKNKTNSNKLIIPL